jgi:hypothetical protein
VLRDRVNILHMVRDGVPIVLLLDYLRQNNIGRLQDVLFDNPQTGASPAILKPDSLLVTVTRPPLSDRLRESKKKINTTNSFIESKIRETFTPYFNHLSRGRIEFSDAVKKSLVEESPYRCDFRFFQKAKEPRKDGAVQSFSYFRSGKKHIHNCNNADGDKTLGFILYDSAVRVLNMNVRLLSVWGMSGITSLLWMLWVTRNSPDILAPKLADPNLKSWFYTAEWSLGECNYPVSHLGDAGPQKTKRIIDLIKRF